MISGSSKRSVATRRNVLVACDRERIVGTGALVPKSHGVAEIVRMSVVGDRRRQGLGRLILKKPIQDAQSRGIRTLVLETTETWREVIQFYLAEGFGSPITRQAMCTSHLTSHAQMRKWRVPALTPVAADGHGQSAKGRAAARRR